MGRRPDAAPPGPAPAARAGSCCWPRPRLSPSRSSATNSHDPSLNHATLGPVANPLGPAGANIADLLYQSFGLAAWLVPVAVAAWGLRLASQREHPWPWLPVLALPMALLAASAFFAGLPHPGMSVWPIRSGLGGIVGYVLLDKLELAVGVAAYLLVSLAVAMVLSMLALGASWRESAWLAGRAGAGSLWVGRRLGRVARRAGARSATALAGQLRRQGGAGRDGRRRAGARDRRSAGRPRQRGADEAAAASRGRAGGGRRRP